jgi:hypothetical protein
MMKMRNSGTALSVAAWIRKQVSEKTFGEKRFPEE